LLLVGLLLPALSAAQTPTHAEEALLRASNAGEDDAFGWSVAIDGDRAIVAASVGVSVEDVAYVFERNADGIWTEVALLRASNAGEDDNFGGSVAIDGDQAIVGASTEDGPSDRISSSGGAYIFERDASGTWGVPDPSGFQTETALLRASNAGDGDFFGRSVAIDGNQAIVGAIEEDGPSDGLFGSGAAYVFERKASGTWTEVALLRASNAGDGNGFGFSVAIDGDRAIVGDAHEDGPSDGPDNSGATYVFERDASGTWGVPDPSGFQTETALLRASNAGYGDSFGHSVAIDGDQAIVGAPNEGGPSDGLSGSGAAYVFERKASGTWTEVALLRASNAGGQLTGDNFGRSVAIDGDQAVAGAPYEGGPSDDLEFSGAAYVFEQGASGTWGIPDPSGFQTETALLRASNAGDGDFFGFSVAIDGNQAIVGAIDEDGPSDRLSGAGAAYVFSLSD
jgi:hypothetical protein